jgi:heptosyltransferase-3
MNPSKIIISRTDSIGDVVLTLPMCVWLKQQFPEAQLVYLGKSYTRAVINSFSVIDQFVDWNEIESSPSAQRHEKLRDLGADVIIHVFPNKEIASLAKQVKIAHRIGTSHRSFHLLTCNHRLNFTRKNSPLHESQLNFELLKPLGSKSIPSMEEINEMVTFFKPELNIDLPEEIKQLLSKDAKKIILHSKSQGSAVEWPLEKYAELAKRLAGQGKEVFFTGTETEGEVIRPAISFNENIHDLTGKLSLDQLIVFISKVDTLVACSTGPLHIAGLTSVKAIGLFSPRKPIHPGRWRPIGKQSVTIVNDPDCAVCKKKKACDCISQISVERVLDEIQ